jgi:acyl-CoA reductase-like NAD-dependent aldehyde dehydrogenase
MQGKPDLLITLAGLLAKYREEIARVNTECVATAFSTNLDNVDRAINTLKKYAAESLKPIENTVTGISVYSCYGDPSFGVFGMMLGPVLLATETDAPIIIGFPSILKKYAHKIKELLATNNSFKNIKVVVGSNQFMQETLTRSEIEISVVFGDQWINQYIKRFAELKKSLLFYGPANNAAVILPGTDMELVAEKIFESAFILNGQAAICINRVLIDDRLNRKEVMRVFQNKLKEIPVGGNPFDTNNYVTPMSINHLVTEATQKLDEAQKNRCLVDGFSNNETPYGTLISPTLVWDCPETLPLWNEYHFFPILPLSFIPFARMAESVNQPEYGLYASIWGNRMELKQLTDTIASNHIMVLKEKSILDIFSIDEGYTGIWGGYRQSGFFMGPQTNWQPKGGGFYLNEILQKHTNG